MPGPIDRASSAAKEHGGAIGIGAAVAGAGWGLSAGVAQLVGMAPALGFFTPIAPIAGAVLVVAGAVYTGRAAWVAGKKIILPKKRKEYIGEVVSRPLLENKYWDCDIIRVAIVGIKRSGKTMIESQLAAKGFGRPNTKQIERRIQCVNTEKKIYVALLDGEGAGSNKRDQQFDITEKADLLVIVVDHNATHSSDASIGSEQNTPAAKNRDNCKIDHERLKEHDEFVSSLRRYLQRQQNYSGALPVIFILNKKDLWDSASEGKDTLTSWLDTVVDSWTSAGISNQEHKVYMSANDNENIDKLKIKIGEIAQAIVQKRGEGR